jgi:outer membrane receptor protein involved in Fe transport
VWIKNATNEIYKDGGYSLGSYATRFFAPPRTFGITVTQTFGGD